MNRFIPSLLLALVWTNTWAQEHQFLNKPETIAKNDVYKMIQYDALDSLSFMEEFSNGYYSIYDEVGLKIKSNEYRSHINKGGTTIHEEYINYYIYNSLNEQIGLIQMFPNSGEPFNIISLKSISLEENSVQTATLESSIEGDSIVFKEYDYSPIRKAFGDTVEISELHSRAYHILDSAMHLDIFYSENGSIDSTEHHTKCNGQLRSMKCTTKTVFSYFSNGTILSKHLEYRSSTSKVNPYLLKEIRYKENGLIDSVKTSYLNPFIDETTLFHFHYEFRED